MSVARISYLSRFNTVSEPMQPKRHRLDMIPMGMIGLDKIMICCLYGIGSNLLKAASVLIRYFLFSSFVFTLASLVSKLDSLEWAVSFNFGPSAYHFQIRTIGISAKLLLVA